MPRFPELEQRIRQYVDRSALARQLIRRLESSEMLSAPSLGGLRARLRGLLAPPVQDPPIHTWVPPVEEEDDEAPAASGCATSGPAPRADLVTPAQLVRKVKKP